MIKIDDRIIFTARALTIFNFILIAIVDVLLVFVNSMNKHKGPCLNHSCFCMLELKSFTFSDLILLQDTLRLIFWKLGLLKALLISL